MINILGNTTIQDTAGVYALLNFLADPAACKARLDELVAQAMDSQKARHELEAASANVNDVLADATAKHNEASEKLKQADETQVLVAEQAKNKEAELTVRENAVVKREHEQASFISNKVKELADRERMLATREGAALNNELIAKANMEKAVAYKTEYENKLKAFKSLAA